MLPHGQRPDNTGGGGATLPELMGVPTMSVPTMSGHTQRIALRGVAVPNHAFMFSIAEDEGGFC